VQRIKRIEKPLTHRGLAQKLTSIPQRCGTRNAEPERSDRKAEPGVKRSGATGSTLNNAQRRSGFAVWRAAVAMPRRQAAKVFRATPVVRAWATQFIRPQARA